MAGKLWLALLLVVFLPTFVLAAGDFVMREKYPLAIDSGVNLFTFDDNVTPLYRLEITSTKSVPSAYAQAYTLEAEPINKYVLPRTALRYFTFSVSGVSSYDISRIVLHLRLPVKTFSEVGPSQVSLFEFNEKSQSWKRVPTEYVSTTDDYYTYVARPEHFGYYALALLESYDVIGDDVVISDATSLQVKSSYIAPESNQDKNEQRAQVLNSEDLVSKQIKDVGFGSELEALQNENSENDLSEPQLQAPAAITGITFIDAIMQDPMSLYAVAALAAVLIIMLPVAIFMLKRKAKPKPQPKKQEVAPQEDELESLKKILLAESKANKKNEDKEIESLKSDLQKGVRSFSQPQADAARPVAQYQPASPVAVFSDADAHLYFDSKIGELQSSLHVLEQLSTNATSQNTSSQVKSIVEGKADEIRLSVAAVEPKLIQTYIDVAKKNGKDNASIFTSLLNAGYDENTIRKYFTGGSA